LRAVEEQLRRAALKYPEAHEDFPWGERAIKVGGKMFLLMALTDEWLGATVKLHDSSDGALALAFVTPTGYGLGRSGWVSARFTSARQVPVDLLLQWVAESYRAVAPRKLVAKLQASAGRALESGR
jgi:predicted DNA-binding protein (MmcQ/YjbR family)